MKTKVFSKYYNIDKLLFTLLLLCPFFSNAADIEILKESEILRGTNEIELAPRTFGGGTCTLTRKTAHQDGKNLIIGFDASGCKYMNADERMKLLTTEGEFILKNISNFSIESNSLNTTWIPTHNKVFFSFKPGKRLSDDALQHSAIKAHLCVSYQCIEDSFMLKIIAEKISDSTRSTSLKALKETTESNVPSKETIQNSPPFGDFEGMNANGSLETLDWFLNGIKQKYNKNRLEFINKLMLGNFYYLKVEAKDDLNKKLASEKRQFLNNILDSDPKAIATEMFVFRPIRLLKYDNLKKTLEIAEYCLIPINYGRYRCRVPGPIYIGPAAEIVQKTFGDDGELLNQGKAAFSSSNNDRLDIRVNVKELPISFKINEKEADALFDLAKSASNLEFKTLVDKDKVGTILMAKIKYVNKGVYGIALYNRGATIDYSIKAVDLCIYDATGSKLIMCKKTE